VLANGLPHQNLHPSRRCSTFDAPSAPQGLFIDCRGTDVRDYYTASRFQDTKAFDDRPFAIGIRSDVVDSEARDHEIEGRIRMRKARAYPQSRSVRDRPHLRGTRCAG